MRVLQATRGTALNRARLAFGLAAAGGLLADQFTKQQALAHLVEGESRPLLGTLLQLRLIFNSGAAFSFGAGLTPVFTVLAAAVLVFALVYLLPRVRIWYWGLTFGLLSAGVAGNLTDRLLRAPSFGQGHVVDFLQLPKWPIFNIADICIVSAALLTVTLSLWAKRGWRGEWAPGKEPPTAAAQTPRTPAESDGRPDSDPNDPTADAVDPARSDGAEPDGGPVRADSGTGVDPVAEGKRP